MTYSKRIFDIILAILLGLFLMPVLVITALVVLVIDGGPVFYISERMINPNKKFNLIKFRTMTTIKVDSGASGGDKKNRITSTGAFLRRTRLDELPQLFNVLKGELSFVGPRPPLRQYVERFPSLYGTVLRSRPGITGLASLMYHRHEERLLASANSPSETDDIYSRVCIPRKAKLDLIYQRQSTMCWDIAIILKTAFRVLK